MPTLIAVDPGLANTGFVVYDTVTKEVLRSETCRNNPAKSNILACCDNASNVWNHFMRIFREQLAEGMTKEDGKVVVVMESFGSFGGKRQSAYTWQTPFVVGYLSAQICTLFDVKLVFQSPREALGGSAAKGMIEALKRGNGVGIVGSQLVTNEHERSALMHALLYEQKN